MPKNEPSGAGRAAGGNPIGDDHVGIPPIPNGGRELYDQIMEQIEPELTSAQAPLLGEKYKDETPEQAASRAARYEKAFAEYRKRFAAFGADWEAQMQRFIRAVRNDSEHLERAMNGDTLSGLDEAMQHA